MAIQPDDLKYIKLDDSQLDSVAGGTGEGGTCPFCSSNNVTYKIVDGAPHFTCGKCGAKYHYDLIRTVIRDN